MTFYGAEGFLANFAVTRVASIAGPPGTGKTLMAFEMAMPFLERDYRFFANCRNVWNDPLYVPWEYYAQHAPEVRVEREAGLSLASIRDKFQLPEICPWVYKRFAVLDEAGRYLRAWKYFENIAQFPRKFSLYFAIPSLRIPHEDLSQLLAICILPFSKILPGRLEGGVYYWTYDQGTRLFPQQGYFVYTSPRTIGVYDTEDLSEATDNIIQAFTAAIDLRQRIDGRNGVSAMAHTAEDGDTDSQRRISERIRNASFSLQTAGRRAR